ncbi:MAG: L-aminopeptidase/D-esterase, partial [Bacillota bacterium]|nr:L-aminopeptidase/D-esterase [Bacillota bacterium]
MIYEKCRDAYPLTQGGLTDVPGILVGHAEDKSGRTGCTVILCPSGAVPGVDVSGGSPGTQNTDIIRPGASEYPVYGVLLTGGSFFGLPASGGVMRWLVENRIDDVPLVPAAIIFDLPYAAGANPPDAAMAYAACLTANSGPVSEGNVGAGAGATIGKIYGAPMKGGLGTASIQIPGGPVVAALAVVNALGDIWDQGRIVVGALTPDGTFVNQTRAMMEGVPSPLFNRNTTIAVVATNEQLTKAEANRVARLADDGMARAISPNHTQWDGDTIFCLSLGSHTSNMSRDAIVTQVGTAAA